MLTREKTRQRILNFAFEHEGETFDATKMSKKDLYDYILADTYLTIDALLGYDSDVNIILDRALENAEKNKKDGFRTFIEENRDKELRIL